jgi:hypothetical protein
MTATKMWVADKVVDVSGVGYNPAGDFTNSGKTLEKEESSTIFTTSYLLIPREKG